MAARTDLQLAPSSNHWSPVATSGGRILVSPQVPYKRPMMIFMGMWHKWSIYLNAFVCPRLYVICGWAKESCIAL